MMGYGYGMGDSGWIAMAIFWVGLITLIIWVLSRGLPNVASRGGDGTRRGEGFRDSAQEILDRRFAAGEIDEETYRSMRAALHSSHAPGQESR